VNLLPAILKAPSRTQWSPRRACTLRASGLEPNHDAKQPGPNDLLAKSAEFLLAARTEPCCIAASFFPSQLMSFLNGSFVFR
jgi:hypothetical protein